MRRFLGKQQRYDERLVDAEIAAEILATLSRQLAPDFGRGFGEENLRRMVQCAEAFPDQEIVAALLRQLGWTHFTMLIPRIDVCQIERRTRLA